LEPRNEVFNGFDGRQIAGGNATRDLACRYVLQFCRARRQRGGRNASERHDLSPRKLRMGAWHQAASFHSSHLSICQPHPSLPQRPTIPLGERAFSSSIYDCRNRDRRALWSDLSLFQIHISPIAPPPVTVARTSSQADHGRLLPWLLVEMTIFWSKPVVLIL
jgi:hypothetical protein